MLARFYRTAIFTLAAIVPVAVGAQRAATASATTPGYRTEFGTMWTFDAPPLDYWRRTYGFSPDQKWLDHVRLSAVRLPNCSASFVSSRGLVMTNHHCGRECTASVSPRDTNYIETGFAAPSLPAEKRCPSLYVDQLQSIENVTPRIRAALTGKTPGDLTTQRERAVDQIQRECAQQTGLTCQVVSLYQGGIYSLYRYRRFNDVRLVMAPEEKIAFFGGDPDNFTYPRFDLDLTLLRVYENDKPYSPPDFLKWSAGGAGENELVFVVGNPGSTGRLNTLAQMDFLRDVSYPARLAGYARSLAIYKQLGERDPAAIRTYQNDVFGVANSQKAVLGYRAGLVDTVNASTKRAFERDFRARLNADPNFRAMYGTAFQDIETAQRKLAAFDTQFRYYGFGSGTTSGGGSILLNMAAQLVRIPAETTKPDSLRLAAYRGATLDRMKRTLSGDVRIDTAYERLALAARFRAARQELPTGDPLIRAALAATEPDAAAAALVNGTRMGDPAFRRTLLEGGAAAVAASTDPMIVLARRIDPLSRTVQLRADSLNAVVAANTEKIGAALFAVYGTALPPDATFSLRISDGVVKGYPMNGTIAPYKTSFYGLYGRSAEFDGKDPFDLPKRWIERRDRLDLSTPFNFVSTNDIIGGNSGSPVINRNAEVVGLIFDGNIEGTGNRFIFNSAVGRSVSVHSRAITEALRKMYDATRIADELEGR